MGLSGCPAPIARGRGMRVPEGEDTVNYTKHCQDECRGAKALLRGQSIAAVVVTYNRPDKLRTTLGSLQSQAHPVDEIIVIDNSSQDVTGAMVRAEFPWFTCMQMPENTGPAGGFSVGMQTAFIHGHDWVWLFNDDAFPEPDTL